jgi:hypothetical protein
MKAWKFLIELNKVCFFMSRERTGKASNSELKRWCMNRAVIVNGTAVKFDEELTEIKSFVLFPKKPVTLF